MFAQSSRSLPDAEHRKAIADAADPKHCTEDCLKAADAFAELSNDYFTEGLVAPAQQAMVSAGDYAQRAAEASVQTRHRQKKTEIGLRKLVTRIADIQRTLAFEDRPPLDIVIKRIEKARTNLLVGMFGNPPKEFKEDKKEKR